MISTDLRSFLEPLCQFGAMKHRNEFCNFEDPHYVVFQQRLVGQQHRKRALIPGTSYDNSSGRRDRWSGHQKVAADVTRLHKLPMSLHKWLRPLLKRDQKL